ncbi:MAG: hypothetical protein ACJ8AT_27965 [Hyalangium sp.]|uniref:hypothetical protein n=1 Tax=Hyalangium sp. TaxID=2028555 RepID=UPI00389AB9DD
MRHGIQSAMVLAAGLLSACAAGSRQVRDEDSTRIEEAMRPEPHPEVIPEGIALGDDAPPLAPPGYELTSPSMTLLSDAGYAQWGGSYGSPVYHSGHRHHPGHLHQSGYLHGPWPPSVRYHIQATPGGTTPGLLP